MLQERLAPRQREGVALDQRIFDPADITIGAGLAGVIAGGDMKIRALFAPVFQCHEQSFCHALARLSASSL